MNALLPYNAAAQPPSHRLLRVHSTRYASYLYPQSTVHGKDSSFRVCWASEWRGKPSRCSVQRAKSKVIVHNIDYYATQSIKWICTNYLKREIIVIRRI